MRTPDDVHARILDTVYSNLVQDWTDDGLQFSATAKGFVVRENGTLVVEKIGIQFEVPDEIVEIGRKLSMEELQALGKWCGKLALSHAIHQYGFVLPYAGMASKISLKDFPTR